MHSDDHVISLPLAVVFVGSCVYLANSLLLSEKVVIFWLRYNKNVESDLAARRRHVEFHTSLPRPPDLIEPHTTVLSELTERSHRTVHCI